MQTNGGKALMKSLEAAGVDVMFGLPGGAILPAYDPLLDSPMRHILVRHEQGAGHMAEGYAHATGRPGVAMVTSGPAATNMVTPLADAMLDSVPLVCITGQVGTASIGTDAFQECDTTGITMAVTKHNFLVTEAADIPQIVHDAFHIATTGRPGPVLVDIPKDLVDPNNPRSQFEDYDPTGHDLPGYNPQVEPNLDAVRAAVELIAASTRPVIYSGGGILKARAADALRELAELLDVHVVTTLDEQGRVPRRPRAGARHARHARQLHRSHCAAGIRPPHHPRCPFRRPRHRPCRWLRTRRTNHPRRYRPGRVQQGSSSRRSHPG